MKKSSLRRDPIEFRDSITGVCDPLSKGVREVAFRPLGLSCTYLQVDCTKFGAETVPNRPQAALTNMQFWTFTPFFYSKSLYEPGFYRNLSLYGPVHVIRSMEVCELAVIIHKWFQFEIQA